MICLFICHRSFFILNFNYTLHFLILEDDLTENTSSLFGSASGISSSSSGGVGGNTKKANLVLMELLEKYFNENPWYDSTNLDEIVKLTGLEEAYIKVNKFI